MRVKRPTEPCCLSLAPVDGAVTITQCTAAPSKYALTFDSEHLCEQLADSWKLRSVQQTQQQGNCWLPSSFINHNPHAAAVPRICSNCCASDPVSWQKVSDSSHLCNACGWYHHMVGKDRPMAAAFKAANVLAAVFCVSQTAVQLNNSDAAPTVCIQQQQRQVAWLPQQQPVQKQRGDPQQQQPQVQVQPRQQQQQKPQQPEHWLQRGQQQHLKAQHMQLGQTKQSQSQPQPELIMQKAAQRQPQEQHRQQPDGMQQLLSYLSVLGCQQQQVAQQQQQQRQQLLPASLVVHKSQLVDYKQSWVQACGQAAVNAQQHCNSNGSHSLSSDSSHWADPEALVECSPCKVLKPGSAAAATAAIAPAAPPELKGAAAAGPTAVNPNTTQLAASKAAGKAAPASSQEASGTGQATRLPASVTAVGPPHQAAVHANNASLLPAPAAMFAVTATTAMQEGDGSSFASAEGSCGRQLPFVLKIDDSEDELVECSPCDVPKCGSAAAVPAAAVTGASISQSAAPQVGNGRQVLPQPSVWQGQMCHSGRTRPPPAAEAAAGSPAAKRRVSRLLPAAGLSGPRAAHLRKVAFAKLPPAANGSSYLPVDVHLHASKSQQQHNPVNKWQLMMQRTAGCTAAASVKPQQPLAASTSSAMQPAMGQLSRFKHPDEPLSFGKATGSAAQTATAQATDAKGSGRPYPSYTASCKAAGIAAAAGCTIGGGNMKQPAAKYLPPAKRSKAAAQHATADSSSSTNTSSSTGHQNSSSSNSNKAIKASDVADAAADPIAKGQDPTGLPPGFKLIRRNRYPFRQQQLQSPEDVSVCSCNPAEGQRCREQDGCLNVAMKVPCTPGTCAVGNHACQNMGLITRKLPRVRLEHMGIKGWGVVAAQDISPGTLVEEYLGEVVPKAKGERRLAAYAAVGLAHTYIMELTGSEVIDATLKGGIARFINHSCEPNCETQKWQVGCEHSIAIIAIQQIPAGTEITYDYNYEAHPLPHARTRCYCGAASCSKSIGTVQTGRGWLAQAEQQAYEIEKMATQKINSHTGEECWVHPVLDDMLSDWYLPVT